MIAVQYVAALIIMSYAECWAKELTTSDLKKGVVSINNNIKTSPYGDQGKFGGSGFLIDNELGILLTNNHVAPSQSIQEIRVTFFNGKEVEAKLLYGDPWQDFAFLKISPDNIPSGAQPLSFSQSDPKVEQSVTMIGNNQLQSYSIQHGVINTIYKSSSFFPGQHMSISLNTRGGASGSPVLNDEGQVLGIIYGGDDTSAIAVPVQYLRDAFSCIQDDNTPGRYDIGAILMFQSLDKLARFGKFPKELVDPYLEKNPDSMTLVITVKRVFEDGPAHGVFFPGDIIWSINGAEIGPELYLLQKKMNESPDKIDFTVYRHGVLRDIEVTPYDLHQATIKKMLIVEGAIFYEVDDLTRNTMGAPLGAVFARNVQDGASFDVFPDLTFGGIGKVRAVQIIKIEEQEIVKLEDLVILMPTLIAQQYFTVDFKNYIVFTAYDNAPIASRAVMQADVEYSGYSRPVLMEYNKTSLAWEETVLEEDMTCEVI
jgi:S1-C subfamily serine protease